MTKLILMIGLPGSGKSFLAQKIQKKYPQYSLVSTDTIRKQLFGDEIIQGPWLAIWNQVNLQFQQAFHENRNVIFDATNTKRSYRKEVIILAKEIGFNQILGLWLNTPLEQCLARNQRRDRHVPEEIIVQMNRQLTDAPPSEDEGLDRVIIV